MTGERLRQRGQSSPPAGRTWLPRRFADVDSAHFPCPLVDILEQVAVDCAQLTEVAGRLRRGIHELHQPGKRKVSFGVIKGDPCLCADLVPQQPVSGSR